jgi:hypothetical protein
MIIEIEKRFCKVAKAFLKLLGALVPQITFVSPPERESSQLSGSLPIFRSRSSGGSP